MEAIDEEVLEQVRNGEISKAGSNGRVRAVQESEYGGLYNRSKHSGTIKNNYYRSFAFSSKDITFIVFDYSFCDVAT